MNSLDYSYWAQLIGRFAVETTLVTGLTLGACYVIKPVVWRRTILQIATVLLLIIALTELTGINEGMGSWLFGKSQIPGPRLVIPFNKPSETFITVPFTPAPLVEPTVIAVAKPVLWPVYVWIAGCALVLGRMLVAQCLLVVFHFRRKNVEDVSLRELTARLAGRLSWRRRVRLQQSPGLRAPIAFGLFRPTIVLPAAFSETFDEGQREAMLVHELAHLAAHDPAWYGVSDLSLAILWWNPAIWWLRRQLRANSELAADEAVMIVEHGAISLAESLVTIGSNLCRRECGAIGVQGSGLKSNLAKRVERLLLLKRENWQPTRASRVFVVRFLSIVSSSVVLLLCSGWQQRSVTRPADLNRAIKQSWSGSLAGLAVDLMFTREDVSPVLPQKNYSSVPALVPPLQPSPDYDYSSFDQFVYPTFPSRPVDPNASGPIIARTDAKGFVYPILPPQEVIPTDPASPPVQFVPGLLSLGDAPAMDLQSDLLFITTQLNAIPLRDIDFHNRPLAEVLKELQSVSLQADPASTGVSFVIDPADVKAISSTPITLSLKNVRLMDALDALIAVAPQPLKYRINKEAVIISATTGKVAGTRKFVADMKRLEAGLTSRGYLPGNAPSGYRAGAVFGTSRAGQALQQLGGNHSSPRPGEVVEMGLHLPMGYRTGLTEAVQSYLKDRLSDAGLARTVLVDDRKGWIIVSGTDGQVKAAEAAIENLVTDPALQVKIDCAILSFDEKAVAGTKFYTEFTKILERGSRWKIDLNAVTAMGAVASETKQVELEERENASLVDDLLHQPDVDVLANVRITTEHGREAEVSVSSNDTNKFHFNPSPFPTVRFNPSVSADTFSVDLVVTPSFQTVTLDPTRKPMIISVKLGSTAVQLGDGHTLLLAGLKTPTQKGDGKPKSIIFFITPRILDVYGERVHQQAEVDAAISKHNAK